jgi:hypothetical protein
VLFAALCERVGEEENAAGPRARATLSAWALLLAPLAPAGAAGGRVPSADGAAALLAAHVLPRIEKGAPARGAARAALLDVAVEVAAATGAPLPRGWLAGLARAWDVEVHGIAGGAGNVLVRGPRQNITMRTHTRRARARAH